jgi:hypothetical protein
MVYSIWVNTPRMPGNFRPDKTYQQNTLYLANKMSGIPHFNAPWFDATAKMLLTFPTVTGVFNPAQHDRDMGFNPALCPLGVSEEMEVQGFDFKKALAADYSWICDNSDGLIIGPRWPDSPGTISEIAVHQALGLPVWELKTFCQYWNDDNLYQLSLPPIMKLGSYGSIIDR